MNDFTVLLENLLNINISNNYMCNLIMIFGGDVSF